MDRMPHRLVPNYEHNRTIQSILTMTLKKYLMIGCSNCVYADEDFVKVFNIPKVQIENLSMKGMGNRYITNRFYEQIYV